MNHAELQHDMITIFNLAHEMTPDTYHDDSGGYK